MTGHAEVAKAPAKAGDDGFPVGHEAPVPGGELGGGFRALARVHDAQSEDGSDQQGGQHQQALEKVRPAITLLGICGFRVIWILTAFAATHSLNVLYLSYPISWLLTGTAQYICYFTVRKKAFARNEAQYAQ